MVKKFPCASSIEFGNYFDWNSSCVDVSNKQDILQVSEGNRMEKRHENVPAGDADEACQTAPWEHSGVFVLRPGNEND